MAKYTTVAQVSNAIEALEEAVENLQKAVRAIYTLQHPERPEPEFPQELPDPETDRMAYDIALQLRREYKQWRMEERWLNKLGGRVEEEPDPEPEEPPATPVEEPPATPIEEPATP